LIWLADNLRISYGDGGVLSLIKMVVKTSNIFPLTVMGNRIRPLDPDARLTLRWPRWYPISADDRVKEAQAMTLLANAGQISLDASVRSMAAVNGVADVEAELNAISQDDS
jgi:hypothetical protein